MDAGLLKLALDDAVPSVVSIWTTRVCVAGGFASVTVKVAVARPAWPSATLTSLMEKVGSASPGMLKFSKTRVSLGTSPPGW